MGKLLSVPAPTAAPAAAVAYAITPQNSKVEWTGSKVTGSHDGSFSGFTGEVDLVDNAIEKSRVNIDIDAATLTSSPDKLVGHLKSPDFFDVAQYPKLHFQSTQVTRAGGKYKVVGNLTLGGQTKPVTLDVDGPVPPQKGGRGGLVSGFSATTTISRKDFNFGPKYSAPMLGDDVKIVLDLEIGQK